MENKSVIGWKGLLFFNIVAGILIFGSHFVIGGGLLKLFGMTYDKFSSFIIFYIGYTILDLIVSPLLEELISLLTDKSGAESRLFQICGFILRTILDMMLVSIAAIFVKGVMLTPLSIVAFAILIQFFGIALSKIGDDPLEDDIELKEPMQSKEIE